MSRHGHEGRELDPVRPPQGHMYRRPLVAGLEEHDSIVPPKCPVDAWYRMPAFSSSPISLTFSAAISAVSFCLNLTDAMNSTLTHLSRSEGILAWVNPLWMMVRFEPRPAGGRISLGRGRPCLPGQPGHSGPSSGRRAAGPGWCTVPAGFRFHQIPYLK